MNMYSNYFEVREIYKGAWGKEADLPYYLEPLSRLIIIISLRNPSTSLSRS